MKIELAWNSNIKGSVEYLKHCKQLIDLYIRYAELTESFFTNVETFLPKLKSLRILFYQQFSDSFIDNFQSMKSIEKVIFYYAVLYSDSKPTKSWCFGKCLSEVMSSPYAKDVILINDKCGLINDGDYFCENPYID